ncbi:tail fiber domain-containing protein [Hymenobacter aerilatus]|uniref:Tail fiber domain-containing protein n=1 Tax=Hymenobacter aerilatus TaxID=2932251 RepID=A0A8T9SXI7_9BACT|nr:tail fiber domain-containing protein [Hymenobacter aerilatus]UOR06437.1 tail fiber domain-containing protein [Hymenobacter aerilatus]
MKHALLQAFLFVLLSLLAGPTLAQTGGSVGIGTSAPDASAVLDVAAPNKGLLIPRLDSAARVGIPAPATGLLVFQTNPRQGFYYYSGAGWRYLPDQTRTGGDNLGNHMATRVLNLQGNALVGTGTSLPAGVRGMGVRADGGLNLAQNTPGENLYVGYQTGQANTGGFHNQFIGRQAGQANTTGNENQFSGYQSGYSNTEGSDNQFSGYQSGYSNTEGRENQFSGYWSGYSNIRGKENQFSGHRSGYYNTMGSYNQFSGYRSGFYNTTGNENQFSGYGSGKNNTTGSRNQFVGYGSGIANSTGSNNWAFGYLAGPATEDLINAGAIGYDARVSQSNSLALGGTGTNAVRVGIGTGAPAAQLEVQLPSASEAASLKLEHRGSNLIVRPLNGGNTASIIENTAGNLLLEPSGQGNVGINQTNPTYRLDVGGSIYATGVIISSDARFKTDVRPLTGALAGALALRGVRYRLNALGLSRGGDAGQQVGLLAQEVEKVYPELVSTDAQGYKAVNYAQLTPVLLEAIRELAAEAATQRARAIQAEATLSSFEQRLRALEAGADRAAAH